MKTSSEEKEAEMELGREVLRWVGPAGIAFGAFLVFSALSGLPVKVPYLSPETLPGFEVVSSGLILWALVMLLAGMAGLYARRPETEDPKAKELEERLALEELFNSPGEEPPAMSVPGKERSQ